MPFKLGGRVGEPVDAFYRTIQAGRPEALRGGAGTEIDAKNMATARMLAIAWRDTQRRTLQGDPTRLTSARRDYVDGNTGAHAMKSVLERWEAFLKISPSDGASDYDRRAAVTGRLVGQGPNTRSGIDTAMIGIFGSWYQGISENKISDIDYAGKVPPGNVKAYYGLPGTVFSADFPGQYSVTYPWSSGLSLITINVQPPQAVPQTTINALIAKALQALDGMLPAWMAVGISQLAAGQNTAGFFCDISKLDFTSL